MKRTAKKAAKKAATKRAKRPNKSVKKSAADLLVPGRNGGLIRYGSLPGNTPGTGRPKNEIRAKLRELAFGKGLDFLAELLEGKLPIRLIGKCEKCGEEGTPDPEWTKRLLERVGASVEHRLRANEQALRFGVGTQSEQVLSEDDIKAWEGHVARYLHDALTAEGWTLDRVGALLSGLDEHMRAFDPRERSK